MTRCAASATASAMSEPSLVALDHQVGRGLRSGVGSVEAGVADRAPRLGTGADRRCRGREARSKHFLAHRRLGDLVDVALAGTNAMRIRSNAI